MKIKKIETWKEDLKLTRPYTIAYETIDYVENCFVLLEAENGKVGMGVASPGEEVTNEYMKDSEGALTKLEAIFTDADIRCYKALLSRLECEMSDTPAAQAAADIALHDLVANSLDLPLVDLLGRVYETLPTSITIGIKSVEETLKDADEYWKLGFRILKVKTGLDVDEDSERLIRLREKYGSEIILRVDANQGYTLTDYQRFLKLTAGANVEMVEQPLKASNLDAMRSMENAIRKQTMADESLLAPQDALELLRPPYPFGIFNIKLMKCGGIAPGLEIARIAQLGGIDLMWGCMDESIVGIAAALHAALASPATKYLDLDGSLDLARDMVEGGFILENGWLRTMDRPGLGIKRI
jgi:L-Ala-D/L-Glu epimerase